MRQKTKIMKISANKMLGLLGPFFSLWSVLLESGQFIHF